MPPLGSIIRVYAVYSKPEHIQNIIKRCENHQKNKQFEDGSKIPDIAIDHLIRCKHEQAIYQQDPNTKRHSVIVPYEKPPSKVQFSDKNILKIWLFDLLRDY